MSIFNFSNNNITNFADDLIYDHTTKAGDKIEIKSFSARGINYQDKSSTNQLISDVNSIFKLQSECKLLLL